MERIVARNWRRLALRKLVGLILDDAYKLVEFGVQNRELALHIV